MSRARPVIGSIAVAAIAACFAACCGEGDGSAAPADGAAARASRSRGDAGTRDGGGIRQGEEPRGAGEAQGEIDENQGVNEIDTVRPVASKVTEPELLRPSFELPPPGAMIRIPAGTFERGSAPEDTLRDQYAENDDIPTPMNEFEIDALPYPNDPLRPFATNVSRAEAEAMCREQGKRLCTELEWERACKGLDNRRYPTGNYYAPDAYEEDRPNSPPSPFGVFAMGRLLEWTASRWGKDPDQVERVAVRGYSPGELFAGEEVSPRNGRRCAKRWHRQPETAAPNLGFRCCRGEVNKEECFIEGTRPAHSLYNNMKPDKFARVIRDVPQLSMIHDNPHMFSDADIRAVLARRANDRKELAKQGIHFRWKPVRWIPRQGMELWVAVGRSNRHSFVVALHEVEDNEKYVFASALVLWNQPVPLALGYRRGHRDQMYWAPCWGCRDGGTIEYDEDKNEVIITHKW